MFPRRAGDERPSGNHEGLSGHAWAQAQRAFQAGKGIGEPLA
jgi:hypothetical protein